MENIFGSIIFEFFGAFVRWFLSAIVNLIRGKKIIGFLEVWLGRKKSSHADLVLQGVSNILIGIFVGLLLTLLFIKLY
jgi:hypothetical protein